MAVILAVNMLVIGIFGSYQTAQAAEIVAGYTALEVIEGILLSFGISIFTTEMVSTLTEIQKLLRMNIGEKHRLLIGLNTWKLYMRMNEKRWWQFWTNSNTWRYWFRYSQF